MKPNELMIGDLVRQKYSGLIIKVSAIYDGYIQGENKDDGQFALDSIEPIPFSEEILEVNRWRYIDWEDGWMNDKILDGNLYSPWEKNPKWLFCITIKIRFHGFEFLYVHEFQHILRICGLNDLANNFRLK